MSFWAALGSAVAGASSGGVLGNWDGGWSTYSSGQSRSKYSANLGYEYSALAARTMPLAQRQGLEKAGYNPLLAIDGGMSSPTMGASWSEPTSGLSGKLDFEGLKGALAKEKKDIAKNEVVRGEKTNDLIDSQNVKTKTEAAKNVVSSFGDVAQAAVNMAIAKKVLDGSASAKGAAKAAKTVGGDAIPLWKLRSPDAATSAKGVGSGLKGALNFVSPLLFTLPVLPSLWTIKKGYDESKDDPKKLMNFVKALRLGAM